jgi:hypothetical protein
MQQAKKPFMFTVPRPKAFPSRTVSTKGSVDELLRRSDQQEGQKTQGSRTECRKRELERAEAAEDVVQEHVSQ